MPSVSRGHEGRLRGESLDRLDQLGSAPASAGRPRRLEDVEGRGGQPARRTGRAPCPARASTGWPASDSAARSCAVRIEQVRRREELGGDALEPASTRRSSRRARRPANACRWSPSWRHRGSGPRGSTSGACVRGSCASGWLELVDEAVDRGPGARVIAEGLAHDLAGQLQGQLADVALQGPQRGVAARPGSGRRPGLRPPPRQPRACAAGRVDDLLALARGRASGSPPPPWPPARAGRCSLLPTARGLGLHHAWRARSRPRSSRFARPRSC